LGGSGCEDLKILGVSYSFAKTHEIDLLITGKRRGLSAIRPLHLLPSVEQRTGEAPSPAALVVNGAGAPGDEKFGRDAKMKEELERNKMVGLPSEERSGGGRYLRSTPAGRLPGGTGVRSQAAARFAGRTA
jgi:hypothetical protein